MFDASGNTLLLYAEDCSGKCGFSAPRFTGESQYLKFLTSSTFPIKLSVTSALYQKVSFAPYIKKGLSVPVIKRILGYCGDKVFCIFFTRIVEDIAAISALDHETVFHYEHTLTKCIYKTNIRILFIIK